MTQQSTTHRPVQGGSYIRRPDGSLERREAAEVGAIDKAVSPPPRKEKE